MTKSPLVAGMIASPLKEKDREAERAMAQTRRRRKSYMPPLHQAKHEGDSSQSD